MSFAGNALIAKAKAIYGKTLDAEDYEALLKKKSVPEIASYLRSHPHYAEILRDVQPEAIHRGRLESLIKQNEFNHTLRLIRFVDVKDNGFYRLDLVRREIAIILEILRAMISESLETQISDIPNYMQRHSTFDIFKASQSTTFQELLDTLVKTPYYDVLRPYMPTKEGNIDYVRIEHAFELYSYECIFREIAANYRGGIRRDLETIYRSKIELENITKIYRLKKFYHADPATIKETLIHQYSRISERRLDEIIALPDPNLILEYLDRSEYRRFIDEKEYVYVEYYAERIKYNLARRFMYFSGAVPKVFAAFVLLGEVETANLINIIEGIRYQLNEADIKRMLIY
jgi:V/A-type H+-transporting ATPase subunit C